MHSLFQQEVDFLSHVTDPSDMCVCLVTLHTWVKVFRFIPELRFFYLARHRFFETCKFVEIWGGGRGGRQQWVGPLTI